MQRTIAQNALTTLAARLLGLGLALGTGVMTARLLGAAGRGLYSLAILCWTLGVLLLGLGIPTANAYQASRKKHQLPLLASNSFLLVLGIGCALAIAVALFRRGFSHLPHGLEQLVPLLAILIPIGILTKAFAGIIQGQNRIKTYNLVQLISPTISLITMGILVGFLRLGLAGALAAWGVGQIAAALVSSVVVVKSSGISLTANGGLMIECLVYGFQVCIMDLIGTLNLRFDMFLVAYFLGAESVGYYSVAILVADIVYFSPSAIATASLPRLAGASTAAEARLIGDRGCRIALFSGIASALVLGLASPIAVPAIYGAAFSPAVAPLLVLLPGVAVYGVAHITTAYFNGRVGKPWINACIAALSLLLDVVFASFLIPRMGLVGAAIASSAAYTIAMLVNLGVYLFYSQSTIWNMLVITKVDFRSLANAARDFAPFGER